MKVRINGGRTVFKYSLTTIKFIVHYRVASVVSPLIRTDGCPVEELPDEVLVRHAGRVQHCVIIDDGAESKLVPHVRYIQRHVLRVKVGVHSYTLKTNSTLSI